MPTIHTIGHTQKSLEEFIHLLQQAGVDAVVDIRLRNTSQLAGFAKRDDLSFLLREGFGIEYEHRPDLAPTSEIFDMYRKDKDWSAYLQAFLPLLDERNAEQVGQEVFARYHAPCLLCSEPTPTHCHRRLVGEWWAERIPGIKINHL